MTTSDTTLPQSMLDRQSDQYLLALAKQAFLALQPNMDTSEQSFPHQLLAPFCLALAELYVDLEDIERRTSLATATGADLDRLGELYGVERTGATKATGTVTFTGSPSSTIWQGYSVTTLGPSSVAFQTTAEATVGGGGTVDVDVEAVVEGTSGNVGVGTITYLTAPVPVGITAVSNAAATTGGTDSQEDGSTNQYAAGYRADIHDLSAARGEGGAAKHLRKWVREVSGVGAVRVLEATPNPGWVQITVVGDDMLPASAAVVEAVEDYLLDPWRLTVEAEAGTEGGFGVSTVTDANASPSGGSNNAVRMVYNASGQGTLVLDGLEAVLPQPGIWRCRVWLKVNSAAGGNNLLETGVYDETAAAYLKTTFGGVTDAHYTNQANDFSTSFAVWEYEFAWAGLNPIQFRLYRLVADTTTQVTVDRVEFWATMSRDDQDVGLTPAGMRLQVQAASQVTVNVAADLTYGLTGAQTEATVQADLHTRLVEYFADRALADDNDVRRAAVEDVIYGTPGIADVTSVTLNGGAANITIGPTQVAVLGTETWT